MIRNKKFWRFLQVFTILLLLSAILTQTLWLLVVIIGLHCLEIPFVLSFVKRRKLSVSETLFNTLLFGFTWWLPYHNEIF
jgi:hypothetical protein